MKAASSDLNDHLQEEVTTLATCWRVTRTDGQQFHFTDHDEDIEFDLDGLGSVATYTADNSYSRTAIKNDDTLAVDNLDVLGVLTDDAIKEQELRRGLFDYAEVEVFLVNYADTTQGALKLRSGWFGEVTLTKAGYFRTELRGLTQAFSRVIGEVYSAECRADLGDHRCKVPIWPSLVARSTVYAVGDYVRANQNEHGLAIVNGDFNTDLSGWTVLAGAGSAKTTSDSLVPQSGARFAEGTGTADFEMEQVVDMSAILNTTVVDAGGYEFNFSAYRANSLASNQGQLVVEFLSAGSTLLGTALDTGLETFIQDAWHVHALSGVPVPALTRKVRVYFKAVYLSGANPGAALDNVRGEFVQVSPTLASDYSNRVYKCTTAGTSGAFLPTTFDSVAGHTTTDGTAVFTAQEAWTRYAHVVDVDTDQPRKKFTVSELTPNSTFANDWFNGGAVTWETGDNAGRSMEVRDFVADNGMVIEQDIELYLDLPFEVQVGDKLRIYPGCDKRQETCSDKFSNIVNMRGEPYVPGQDTINTYPDAQS